MPSVHRHCGADCQYRNLYGRIDVLVVKKFRKKDVTDKFPTITLKGEYHDGHTTNGIDRHPKVVSHAEWLAARKEHLAKEKELTRQRDKLGRERRELPWEKMKSPTYSRAQRQGNTGRPLRQT